MKNRTTEAQNTNKDIHNYAYRLKNSTDRLERIKNISNENKTLIKKFIRDKQIQGLSAPRLEFYTIRLTKLADYFGKDFDKATTEDLKELVSHIQDKCNYAKATQSDYKKTIKQFYFWLGKEALLKNGMISFGFLKAFQKGI